MPKEIEPSDWLRHLAAEGRQLRVEVIQHLESLRKGPRNVATGVDLLDAFFDLSGYKRTAVRVGKALVEGQAAKKESELTQRYGEWSSAVRKELGDISELKPGLTIEGNAQELIERFSASQNFSRLETKLAHGIRFLEALADRRLVRNEHLVEVLNGGRRPESVFPDRSALSDFAPSPIAPLPLELLRASEERTLTELEARFPVEHEAMVGAMSTYAARGPDSGRQALGSCRNCLESLVRRLSGEGDWTVGLTKLIPSDAHNKAIRVVYSYLCAYGSHGTSLPSSAIVEMGIGMTIVAVRSILASIPT